MRYRFSCAALAAIMLLSGCASTDIQNDPHNPSDPNSLDLMADLVSGGNSSVTSQTAVSYTHLTLPTIWHV